MAKLKDGTSRLTSADLVVKGRTIVTKMTDNPVYAALQAQLPAIADACDVLSRANQEANFLGGKLVFAGKRMAELRLRAHIADLAPAVQALSGGDAGKILSAGFDVARTPKRLGVPGVTYGFKALHTPYESVVKLRWLGQEAAHFYQIEQLGQDGSTWTVVATTTRISHSLSGLVSGQRYSFRVHAVGAAGPGPVSYVVQAKAA